MARRIQNKQNVMAPTTDYPYGDIKDNVGDGSGTAVNRANHADFHQYFDRLMDISGIAANGLADNATNRYQLFEALLTVMRRGIIWTSRSSAANNLWTAVTYGNGLYVAVSNTGTGNRVMTSPDGVIWTIRVSAANDAWSGVAYGNGVFVAVSGSGTVMTSPDGITWTTRTAAAANNWTAITYGNGLFVAVSSNGTNRAMTSPDGITWTSRAAVSGLWVAITYGNGLFVATPSNTGGAKAMTSPDGITWTSRTTPSDQAWNSIAYGNGNYVAAAGIVNGIMTSPDGINWTQRVLSAIDSSGSTLNITSMAFGNGMFVAVSDTGYCIMSPDGISWTYKDMGVHNTWSAVTFGNGLFVTVSLNGSGNRVMTST